MTKKIPYVCLSRTESRVKQKRQEKENRLGLGLGLGLGQRVAYGSLYIGSLIYNLLKIIVCQVLVSYPQLIFVAKQDRSLN